MSQRIKPRDEELDRGQESGGYSGSTSTPRKKKGLGLSEKLAIAAFIAIGALVLYLAF